MAFVRPDAVPAVLISCALTDSWSVFCSPSSVVNKVSSRCRALARLVDRLDRFFPLTAQELLFRLRQVQIFPQAADRLLLYLVEQPWILPASACKGARSASRWTMLFFYIVPGIYLPGVGLTQGR